jgi:STE24 endopeptidase
VDRVDRSGLRLASAVLASVAVAEAAVLLLRPRDQLARVPANDVPPATSYFSRPELQRAERFRGPQRWLAVGTLAVEAGALAWLVARPPGPLRRRHRRPILAAAAAGAGITTGMTVVTLPLDAIARRRAKDVGLVTQRWGAWAGDVLKMAAIDAVVAAGGTALGVALMRRLPQSWWVAGAGAVVTLAAGLMYAQPVVLDPLFNRFTALPAGTTRDDVLEIAGRAGVRIGTIQVMDASRRTTAANAYVTGLGPTKRVVLYDTLIDRYSREELRSVLAHELAHVQHDDVPRGLLYVLLVAPAGMLAIAQLTGALRRDRGAKAGAAAVPALMASAAVVSAGIGLVANGLSRRVEARADATTLQLTGEPDAFIGFQRRVALQNVSDPDPPRGFQLLYGTHPTTMQRIAIARRAAAEERR